MEELIKKTLEELEALQPYPLSELSVELLTDRMREIYNKGIDDFIDEARPVTAGFKDALKRNQHAFIDLICIARKVKNRLYLLERNSYDKQRSYCKYRISYTDSY